MIGERKNNNAKVQTCPSRLFGISVIFALSVFIMALSFPAKSTGQAPVARDDFYIVDRSQYLEVSLNDENPSGQMVFPTYPAGVFKSGK